ncbi:hypothetical protein GGX14DRAFT_578056 [Mycena pura]|uniref:CCHC-type domain-containing protein n=1 Tax=Mycena pura TaxID=153505 RepID=A0AAD6UQE7_9AGAR|nr:hypothetical protein GGX14DRAFT_578056 [Mycena pura]
MFWPAATLPAAAPGSNAAPQALAFDARCLCNAPAGACVGSVALQRRPPCCHPPPLPRCNGAQRAAGACSRGNGPSLSTPVPAAALQLRCRVATPVPHHRPTFPPSPQLRCNAARNMEFIVQQVQPGLDANTLGASAGASGGHPFDWLVRLMNALLPTPVTDLGPIHRVVASFDVVWIGDGRFDIVEHVELSRTRKDAVDGLATEPLDTCLPPIGMASESAAAVLRHAAVITAGWAATKDTMSPGAKCAGDKLTVVSQVVRDDTLDERRDSAACCSESGGPNYLYENPSPLGVQISSSTVGDKTAVMEKMSGVPALMPSAVTRQGRVEGASMGNKFKWAFNSGGDSSNSESSSDESGVKRHPKVKAAHKRSVSRKERRKAEKVLASIKVRKPFVYQGKADLDLFDEWTYQVDTWAELHGLDDATMVKIIVNFMGGRASQFFMKHVALRRKKWTVKSVYEGLFDYCFPPNFKWRLREELMQAMQGSNSVRDFVREIEDLATRFPDVSERQIKQIFWDGLRKKLRIHLIGKGQDPEHTSLAKMVKYATRQEAVKEALRMVHNPVEPGDDSADSGSAVSSDYDDAMSDREDRDSYLEGASNAQEAGLKSRTLSTTESVESDRQPEQSKAQPSHISQKEYEKLRREGRCFKCKARGHLSRDCNEASEDSVDEQGVEAKAAHFKDSSGSEELESDYASSCSSIDVEEPVLWSWRNDPIPGTHNNLETDAGSSNEDEQEASSSDDNDGFCYYYQ